MSRVPLPPLQRGDFGADSNRRVFNSNRPGSRQDAIEAGMAETPTHSARVSAMGLCRNSDSG